MIHTKFYNFLQYITEDTNTNKDNTDNTSDTSNTSNTNNTSKSNLDLNIEDGNKTRPYNKKNLVLELCVAMVLINPTFLDNLLDSGNKSRYVENSQVFITDLKTLLLSKNRLKLGIFVDQTCIEDTELSKINSLFVDVDFDIERDWKKLINARITARNIMDKSIPNSKLTSDMIKYVYWIGPNKTREYSEDIVIELVDDSQKSYNLNRNVVLFKSASFNVFAKDIIGEEYNNLFEPPYIDKWNKAVQFWGKLIYENSKKPIQLQIEKFINPNRFDSLTYFRYFEITHSDDKFKYLGEYMPEFDENVKELSTLLSLIWNNRDKYMNNPDDVYDTWMKYKVQHINAGIFEHLFTESIMKYSRQDVSRVDKVWKKADGNMKMKLIKTFVEKIGSLERDMYHLGTAGNVMTKIPKRQWFRDNYDNFDVHFDYHVKMVIDEEDENKNDFIVKTIMFYNNEILLKCDISTRFSSGEMSGKLSGKYQFEIPDNFNLLVAKNDGDTQSVENIKDEEIINAELDDEVNELDNDKE